MENTILWRRLDRPGHESARLIESPEWHELEGAAVFVESNLPVRLDYRIRCDERWQTCEAAVRGWIGSRRIDAEIEVVDGRWMMNGAEMSGLSGCIDVDLNFSPSTNLLPIRRLGLEVGRESLVRAAWLRFPSFELEVLEQRYSRVDRNVYRYVSGSFTAELTVNDAGLPVSYAGVWVAEASGPAE
jgi:hypothetical protein